ncbi:hypothetical protein [Bacteroides sp. 51]|uniref:hypothetical protein n=1 Tax=Bacteroides sp. 51 TaxID=2302938 RepID=UPI0013D65E5E|nr:hypothetical protein [Bacteroides sp. 51]NDV81349.1 hypothetical protein [Bacteroides sp. 51]
MEDIFKDIEVTDEQQAILDKAMELLKPYDKEETTNCMCYFTDKDGHEFSSEYDCCSDEKCIEKAKKEIRRNHGNRTIIEENITDTSSDHESFDRCCICYCYFNEYLTWIHQEFSHHEEYSVTADDLKSSNTAFELRGIYYSLYWSCDHQISQYSKHQYHLGNEKPLNDALDRQKDLINRVVKHASLVIGILSK